MRPLQERFWEKVDKTETCWNWSGYLITGYGQFRTKTKMEYAHRVSYKMNIGDIPSGLFVLHKCDNRRCVNPSHLFLGTLQDNMDDKVYKNRQYKKVDEDKMRTIRELYASGRYSQRSLAKEVNVSASLVSLIVKGYKHVTI